jgi:hypothetical protein
LFWGDSGSVAMSTLEEFHRGGSFYVPMNFTLETLLEYMKLNLPELRRSRDMLQKNIKEMRLLMDQLKFNLRNSRAVDVMTDTLPILVLAVLRDRF